MTEFLIVRWKKKRAVWRKKSLNKGEEWKGLKNDENKAGEDEKMGLIWKKEM